jgi:hypothetical protein
MVRKTWKWQLETRAAILANDNGRCVACGCADTAVLEIDHIIPAGPTTVENGQALCGPCNRAKADVYGLLELSPFKLIPRNVSVGNYLDGLTTRRAKFAADMSELRRQEDAGLLEWARSEIGNGRRVAAVIRSIAGKHNRRVAQRVARAL